MGHLQENFWTAEENRFCSEGGTLPSPLFTLEDEDVCSAGAPGEPSLSFHTSVTRRVQTNAATHGHQLRHELPGGLRHADVVPKNADRLCVSRSSPSNARLPVFRDD